MTLTNKYLGYSIKGYAKDGDCRIILRDEESGQYKIFIETTEEESQPCKFIPDFIYKSDREMWENVLNIIHNYPEIEVKEWHYEKIKETVCSYCGVANLNTGLYPGV